MAQWEKVHEEKHGSRGRWTWRLRITGGWLLLVRAADDAIWGGVTFVPDPTHESPPQVVEDGAE